MRIVWPKEDMIQEFVAKTPKNQLYYDSLKAVIESNYAVCGMDPKAWSTTLNKWAITRPEEILVFIDQDATDGFLDLKIRGRNAVIWFSITDQPEEVPA